MVFKTGNKNHDDALVAAEQARQVANVGATAAQTKANDIAYGRAAKASCVSNNGGSGVEQFTVMLRELGTGGA
jgi:hypothetical protein